MCVVLLLLLVPQQLVLSFVAEIILALLRLLLLELRVRERRPSHGRSLWIVPCVEFHPSAILCVSGGEVARECHRLLRELS